MKTRMERYFDKEDEAVRVKKNQELYDDMYQNLPSSGGVVPSNESEIDLSKLKELVANREGYKRVKQYETIMQTKTIEEDNEEQDMFDDIDNKIYDINMILEEAKAKRPDSERERYRSLRNTQYDILSKLNLNEEPEKEEMATDFFTKDNEIKKLLNIEETSEIEDDSQSSTNTTSSDLFDELKGNENTILTEPVKEEEPNPSTTVNVNEASFYTSHLNFTKEDFEGFQNLQTTVKKNNRLIKILIFILTVVLVAIAIFLAFTMM